MGRNFKDKNVCLRAGRELEAWRQKYWNAIGDDEMMDGIDSAQRRLNELHKDRMEHPENWRH